ncbi:MAG TPA: DUF6130 family protein [Tepidisphaeraceae bacterium]|jgi:hypothetical protein
MKPTLFIVAAVVLLEIIVGVTRSASTAGESSASGSAKDGAGANVYVAIENEPPPKLFVDQPDERGLPLGVVWLPVRVENCRILPLFNKTGVNISPRVGHLHVHVDDLPFWWADSSGLNTIDIAGLPPGEHKVLVELVDSDHNVYPGQAKTVKFTIPQSAARSH